MIKYVADVYSNVMATFLQDDRREASRSDGASDEPGV